MGRLIRCQQSRDLLLGAALTLSALSLMVWPQQAMQAMRDGLSLCCNVIVPSLFPFFVLSSLTVELGLSRYLGRLLEPIMVPLFRVNGACATALALGFVGGYPVGARTAIGLYQNGQCTKDEAERLLAFCNNCGPAFILGVVGTGVFGSSAAGLFLYAGHILASLLVGFIFRFYGQKDTQTSSRTHADFHTCGAAEAFAHSVTGAMGSLLNICAFILFFSVLLRMLTLSGVLSTLAGLLSTLFAPVGMTLPWAERLLTGLLELSSGVSTLSQGALSGRLSMAAFMLGWAGLSVHCQVMAFLGDSGLSLGPYAAGKLLHALFSSLIVGGLVRLFPLDQAVSAYLAQQTETIVLLDFYQALSIASAAAWATWVVFFLLALLAVKKSSRKRLRSVL